MEMDRTASDVVSILPGGIMVLAMHSGFAFLELGTVRKTNQVNALVRILVDFAVSTITHFFVGFSIAYGLDFFSSAETLMARNGFELTRCFLVLTFAAAIPAIISGGIADRALPSPVDCHFRTPQWSGEIGTDLPARRGRKFLENPPSV